MNNVNDFIEKISKKNRLDRYGLFIIAMFIFALSFNMFYASNNIMTEGISGFSLIIRKFFGVQTSITILITSFMLLIVCYIFLGKKMATKSILGTILYAFFVRATVPIVEFININNIDLVVAMIYGGILMGFANGLIIRTGFLSGGFQVIYKIMNKYLKISIGNASLIINSILIIIGCYNFGLPNTFYALISIVICTFMTDKVILGISECKNFYIITKKEKEISEYLANNVKNNFTIVDVRGGYTDEKKKMIVCALPTKEYTIVKEVIIEIDRDAFFLITDNYEVSKKKSKNK